MEQIEQEKIKFLKWQFWNLTISASFSRAYVYKTDADSKRKEKFKKHMFYQVETIAKSQLLYDEQAFVKAIAGLVEESNIYNDILNGERLRFGIAQKMVNLYSKYLWCAGLIDKKPLHFPLDRIVQKNTKIIKWTELDDADDYLRKIHEICPESNKAEWELTEYNKLFYK